MVKLKKKSTNKIKEVNRTIDKLTDAVLDNTPNPFGEIFSDDNLAILSKDALDKTVPNKKNKPRQIVVTSKVPHKSLMSTLAETIRKQKVSKDADRLLKIMADAQGITVTELKKQQIETKKYKETHWCNPLSDNQKFLIATTQDKPPYLYMTKPLSRENVHSLVMYMNYNTIYKRYMENVERIKRLREGIEKPFKPLMKFQKQVEDLNKRFAFNYFPEQEALRQILRPRLPFDWTGDKRFSPTAFVTDGLLSDGVVGEVKEVSRIDQMPPVNDYGIKGYKEIKGIKHNVDIAKLFAKEKHGLIVKDWENLKYVTEAMNCNHLEAFIYICQGIAKSYKHHRFDKEILSEPMAHLELIDTYKKKVAERKKAGKPKYTQIQFWSSKEFKDFCKQQGREFKSFKTFNKWWNEILRITTSKATKKAYKKAKGLLN